MNVNQIALRFTIVQLVVERLLANRKIGQGEETSKSNLLMTTGSADLDTLSHYQSHPVTLPLRLASKRIASRGL